MFYSVCFLMFHFYFLIRVSVVRMVKHVSNQSSDITAAHTQTAMENSQALSTSGLPFNHHNFLRENKAGW